MASPDKPPQRGAVLAFDFGERRIGVAIGDLELGIAHPLKTIDEKDDEGKNESIESLVNEWNPVLFVVGMPVNTDGSEHALTLSVRRFSDALKNRFGIDSRFVDERFTSAEASDVLAEAGVRGRKQKTYIDQVAAQTILEDFFASGGHG